jgi:hypothetical protein
MVRSNAPRIVGFVKTKFMSYEEFVPMTWLNVLLAGTSSPMVVSNAPRIVGFVKTKFMFIGKFVPKTWLNVFLAGTSSPMAVRNALRIVDFAKMKFMSKEAPVVIRIVLKFSRVFFIGYGWDGALRPVRKPKLGWKVRIMKYDRKDKQVTLVVGSAMNFSHTQLVVYGMDGAARPSGRPELGRRIGVLIHEGNDKQDKNGELLVESLRRIEILHGKGTSVKCGEGRCRKMGSARNLPRELRKRCQELGYQKKEGGCVRMFGPNREFVNKQRKRIGKGVARVPLGCKKKMAVCKQTEIWL